MSQSCAESRQNGGRCYFGITSIWSAFFFFFFRGGGQISHAAMLAERVTSQNARLSVRIQKTISWSHRFLCGRKRFTLDLHSPFIVSSTGIASEQFKGRCLCVVNKLQPPLPPFFFSSGGNERGRDLERVEKLESWNPKWTCVCSPPLSMHPHLLSWPFSGAAKTRASSLE